MDCLSARRSRAVEYPMEILPASLSISATDFKCPRMDLRTAIFSFVSSTASILALISEISTSGYRSHFFKSLPPMAVTVTSITLSSVPWRDPDFRFLNNSRLLKLTSSINRKLSSAYVSRPDKCLISCF